MIKRQFGDVDRQIIEQYFSTHQIRKIHIGCAFNLLEGWLNADYTLFSKNVIFLMQLNDFHLLIVPLIISFNYIYS